MQFKTFGVFFLLALGAANLFAEPGHRRGVFNTVRAYQMQGIASERGEQGPRQPDRDSEHRRRGPDLPDSSGYGAQGESSPPQDNGSARKQGRLSPEERRALRRQIDEAGHDIYTPKR